MEKIEQSFDESNTYSLFVYAVESKRRDNLSFL